MRETLGGTLCKLLSFQVSLDFKSTELSTDCNTVLVPTPKTQCYDEDVEACFKAPKLEEGEEHINRCSLGIAEKCDKVRLTIPKKTCVHVAR